MNLDHRPNYLYSYYHLCYNHSLSSTSPSYQAFLRRAESYISLGTSPPSIIGSYYHPSIHLSVVHKFSHPFILLNYPTIYPSIHLYLHPSFHIRIHLYIIVHQSIILSSTSTLYVTSMYRWSREHHQGHRRL